MTDQEPTEMAVAFQRAEAERRERESREQYAQRHRTRDLDPERRDSARKDIEQEIARLVAAPKEDSEHVMSNGLAIETTTGHEKNTSVAHPVHYNADPSGVECITIVRHRNFNVGNAIKYLWRAGLKEAGIKLPGHDAKEIEDLKKARWYIADEIRRLGGDPDDE
jgi:hypothetical protein